MKFLIVLVLALTVAGCGAATVQPEPINSYVLVVTVYGTPDRATIFLGEGTEGIAIELPWEFHYPVKTGDAGYFRVESVSGARTVPAPVMIGINVTLDKKTWLEEICEGLDTVTCSVEGIVN